MELWERLKSVFVNWKRLLEQIPDTDRLDSYRYDEIQKKWVLLSSMPEAEVPILDDNRRLQVVTPDFVEYSHKYISSDLSASFNEVIELDFLCDSISFMAYNLGSGGKGRWVRIYYYDNEDKVTIGSTIFSYWSSDGYGASELTLQYDTKPFSCFQIQFAFDAGYKGDNVRILFSKQKKTKISDVSYASSWDAIIDVGASKNAIYDELVSHYANETEHHTATIASDLLHNALSGLNLGDLQHLTDAQIAVLHNAVIASDLLHNELSGLNVGANVKHLTDVQMSALHNATIASDLLHNELSGLNVGANVKHLTDVQMNALHNATIASDLLHNDLSGLNAGTNLEHITQTQKDALHTILDGYTKAEIEAFFRIGSANKKWKTCILEGGNDFSYFALSSLYTNKGADNVSYTFGIPLDLVIGNKNLVITKIKLGVYFANGTNYVTRLRLRGWVDYNSITTIVDDTTNRTSSGEYIYDHDDATIGGTYTRIFIYIETSCADANDLDLSFLQVEYYYT